MHAISLLNRSEKIRLNHLVEEAKSEDLIAKRARAKFDIADIYMQKSKAFSGLKKQKLKEIAVFWLNESAQDYNPRACNALARLFLHGDTVNPCAVLAMRLSLAATELGNEKAQITLDMATATIKRGFPKGTQAALNLIH